MLDEFAGSVIGGLYRGKIFKQDGVAVGANDIDTHRVFTGLKDYLYVVHRGSVAGSRTAVCD